MVHRIALFIHLSAAIIWIGGMVFAYFCLRPAAAECLDPPQRLPLWVASFRRFFRLVAVAVVVLLASGFTLLPLSGLAVLPHGWLAMMGLGLVMALVFAYLYAVRYPRLVVLVGQSRWPEAAAVLDGIRRLVAVNLVLSLLVVAAAVSAR